MLNPDTNSLIWSKKRGYYLCNLSKIGEMAQMKSAVTLPSTDIIRQRSLMRKYRGIISCNELVPQQHRTRLGHRRVPVTLFRSGKRLDNLADA